jgi:hypothetical protein
MAIIPYPATAARGFVKNETTGGVLVFALWLAGTMTGARLFGSRHAP